MFQNFFINDAPYFRLIYGFFKLNLRVFASPHFDHDAFMQRALHVLDALSLNIVLFGGTGVGNTSEGSRTKWYRQNGTNKMVPIESSINQAIQLPLKI